MDASDLLLYREESPCDTLLEAGTTQANVEDSETQLRPPASFAA